MINKINPFFQKIKHLLFNHTYFFYLKILVLLLAYTVTTIKPKININLLPYLVGSHYYATQLGLGLSIQTLQQYRRPLRGNSTQFTGSVQGLVVFWQRCLPLKFNSFAVINKNIRHFNNKAAISYFKIPATLRSQHPFVLPSLAIIPHRSKNKVIFSELHTVSTTFVKSKTLTNEQFHQWLVGFSDGESNFHIQKIESKSKRGGFNFGFRYKIKLHLDDLEVLKYIKNKINCGIIAAKPL